MEVLLRNYTTRVQFLGEKTPIKARKTGTLKAFHLAPYNREQYNLK
jgi:hypothetical protein